MDAADTVQASVCGARIAVVAHLIGRFSLAAVEGVAGVQGAGKAVVACQGRSFGAAQPQLTGFQAVADVVIIATGVVGEVDASGGLFAVVGGAGKPVVAGDACTEAQPQGAGVLGGTNEAVITGGADFGDGVGAGPALGVARVVGALVGVVANGGVVAAAQDIVLNAGERFVGAVGNGVARICGARVVVIAKRYFGGIQTAEEGVAGIHGTHYFVVAIQGCAGHATFCLVAGLKSVADIAVVAVGVCGLVEHLLEQFGAKIIGARIPVIKEGRGAGDAAGFSIARLRTGAVKAVVAQFVRSGVLTLSIFGAEVDRTGIVVVAVLGCAGGTLAVHTHVAHGARVAVVTGGVAGVLVIASGSAVAMVCGALVPVVTKHGAAGADALFCARVFFGARVLVVALGAFGSDLVFAAAAALFGFFLAPVGGARVTIVAVFLFVYGVALAHPLEAGVVDGAGVAVTADHVGSGGVEAITRVVVAAVGGARVVVFAVGWGAHAGARDAGVGGGTLTAVNARRAFPFGDEGAARLWVALGVGAGVAVVAL